MTVTRRHRDLLLAASLLTYLLVTLGGIVCVTDASRGCPDWPACYGRIVPPPRLDSILEYTHRVLAGLASLAIVAAALVGWRSRAGRWVRWPPAMAVVLVAVVIVLGALGVVRGLEPGLAALDLGSALLVLALMVAATVVAVARHGSPGTPHRPSFHSVLARLALWTMVLVWLVLVSGVLVAEGGSVARCLGWPLFGGGLDLAGARGWFQGARRLAGGLAGVLIFATVVQAWRAPGQQGGLRIIATAVGLAFAMEVAVGLFIVMRGAPVWLYTIYATAAATLWALLVALFTWAGLASSRSF
jgi:cytochrome c oxidase assembly protein subunit 15